MNNLGSNGDDGLDQQVHEILIGTGGTDYFRSYKVFDGKVSLNMCAPETNAIVWNYSSYLSLKERLESINLALEISASSPLVINCKSHDSVDISDFKCINSFGLDNKNASKVQISKCEFNDAVSATNGLSSLKINSCIFSKESSLTGLDFLRFSNCTFLDNYNLNWVGSGTVKIINCAFEQCFELSIENIKRHQVDLSRCKFLGLVFIKCKDASLDDLNFSGVEFGLPLYPLGINEIRKYKESYTALRMEFNRLGREYEALNLRRIEFTLLRKELQSTKGSRVDKTILFFNSISNDFGYNWMRGVAFTMSVTALAYFMYCLTIVQEIPFAISSSALITSVTHYFELLNLTNWEFRPFGIPNQGGYIILFLARIFIGYGYYQTITAFRKYGKK